MSAEEYVIAFGWKSLSLTRETSQLGPEVRDGIEDLENEKVNGDSRNEPPRAGGS